MDLALALVFFQFRIIGAHTVARVAKAVDQTGDDLKEVNYSKIKRALKDLHRKGLINSIKDDFTKAQVTKLGRKRLNSILPQYQTRRPWDKKLYLVTYDIPVASNSKRDALRDYLKTIGCGLLQESVWVTPYNPTDLAKEFALERDLEGTILVSALGREGSVGNMNLEELVDKVYNLSELNKRYENFLTQVRAKSLKGPQVMFAYLSILKDDPQLPFELLPEDWGGDTAYRVLQKNLRMDKKG